MLSHMFSCVIAVRGPHPQTLWCDECFAGGHAEQGADPLQASVSPLHPMAWALPLAAPSARGCLWVILSLRLVLEEGLPWKQRLRLRREGASPAHC